MNPSSDQPESAPHTGPETGASSWNGSPLAVGVYLLGQILAWWQIAHVALFLGTALGPRSRDRPARLKAAFREDAIARLGLIFCLATGACTVFGYWESEPLKMAARIIGLAILPLFMACVWDAARHHPKALRIAAGGLVLAAAATALVSIAWFWSHPAGTFEYDRLRNVCIYAEGLHPVPTGMLFGFAAIAVLAWPLEKAGRARVAGQMALLAVLLTGCLLTKSRGPILATLAGYVTCLAVRRGRGMLVPLLVLAAGAAIMVFSPLPLPTKAPAGKPAPPTREKPAVPAGKPAPPATAGEAEKPPTPAQKPSAAPAQEKPPPPVKPAAKPPPPVKPVAKAPPPGAGNKKQAGTPPGMRFSSLLQRKDGGRFKLYRVLLERMDPPRDYLLGRGLWAKDIAQPPDQHWYAEHAHSAYLAAFYHGGLLGAAILAIVIGLGAGRAVIVLRTRAPESILWLCLWGYGFTGLLFDGASLGSLCTVMRLEPLLFWFPLIALSASVPRGRS